MYIYVHIYTCTYLYFAGIIDITYVDLLLIPYAHAGARGREAQRGLGGPQRAKAMGHGMATGPAQGIGNR